MKSHQIQKFYVLIVVLQNGEIIMTQTYSISKTISWKGTLSDKAASVCRMFGLTVDRLAGRSLTHHCRLDIEDGDIVYVTGPSGAGKSLLLSELEKQIPQSERVNLNQIELPPEKTLVDCIDGNVLSTLRLLGAAGLSDCYCVLSRPENLSAGQKYRFRLALALAAEKRFVFADEFCSELDRITALVISQRLREYANRNNTVFILASCHDDIMLSLAPDIMVVKDLTGGTDVVYRDMKRK